MIIAGGGHHIKGLPAMINLLPGSAIALMEIIAIEVSIIEGSAGLFKLA